MVLKKVCFMIAAVVSFAEKGFVKECEEEGDARCVTSLERAMQFTE